MPAHESPAGPEAQRNIAGRAAIAAAAGAVMCGVCFVLPSALPSVVLASAGSVLALVGHAQRWVTAVAVIAVAGAWIWIWRQSVRVRARPASATLYLMGVATALLALALVWPVIEPHIARVLGNL